MLAFGASPFDLFIVVFWGVAALVVIAARYGWLDVFKNESP